ncbi:acVLRF1 family peptidyl-tRNA hydrolase [Mangrovihabitans endophyticus]|uniref:acVLRF1 family peptidyl-tRNA hydrolase n=1 Tax=Mangrovihabitans endophyticus TaxID=1751298 RepID=UPI001669A5A9|nr:acVLRF1 family peptidyl-tRNA hydrolase [Mangrovihabitans endophyticus]
MKGRPAAGGGRWVDVAPDRLPRWLENFAVRHGAYRSEGLTVTAADGAVARFETPIGADPVDSVDDLVRTAARPRRLGLLLARKAAVAVGVADGSRLLASKVDTHYVQGRTAAGGWSQQRFARRRANQAKAAAAGGADVVARVLLPHADGLAALVTGGDRAAIDAILSAPHLSPLVLVRAARVLEVPEPRHAVLLAAIDQARAVPVLVRDP